jgi:hypothetical protein
MDQDSYFVNNSDSDTGFSEAQKTGRRKKRPFSIIFKIDYIVSKISAISIHGSEFGSGNHKNTVL